MRSRLGTRGPTLVEVARGWESLRLGTCVSTLVERFGEAAPQQRALNVLSEFGQAFSCGECSMHDQQA